MSEQDIDHNQFTMTFSSVNNTHELNPATVSIPILIDALQEIDQGARAYAPPEIAKNKSIPVISLIRIQFGSLQLQYESPPEYSMYAEAFIADLENHNWDTMPLEAYRAAEKLHKTAVRLKANIGIVSTTNNVGEFYIHASDPSPKRNVGMVTGSLSLSGQIIQTGGAKPAIDFRFDINGKIRHGISVDTNTARMVGQRLYTPVVIHGQATWNAGTWEIEDFQFTGLSDSQYQTPSDALNELHQILGNTWSNIDVESFVSDLRGGEA